VKYRGSNFLSEKSYEVLKKIHLQTKEVWTVTPGSKYVQFLEVQFWHEEFKKLTNSSRGKCRTMREGSSCIDAIKY
jgi:hypothetical protein